MDSVIYMKLAGAMALVLGLLLLLSYGLKKWGYAIQGKGSGLIEVLETRMILPRRHICIVRVGRRVMILASSDKGIEYLGDLDEEARGSEDDSGA